MKGKIIFNKVEKIVDIKDENLSKKFKTLQSMCMLRDEIEEMHHKELDKQIKNLSKVVDAGTIDVIEKEFNVVVNKENFDSIGFEPSKKELKEGIEFIEFCYDYSKDQLLEMNISERALLFDRLMELHLNGENLPEDVLSMLFETVDKQKDVLLFFDKIFAVVKENPDFISSITDPNEMKFYFKKGDSYVQSIKDIEKLVKKINEKVVLQKYMIRSCKLSNGDDGTLLIIPLKFKL